VAGDEPALWTNHLPRFDSATGFVNRHHIPVGSRFLHIPTRHGGLGARQVTAGKIDRAGDDLPFCGGTALARLNGHVSVPSLTMRPHSAVLWLWGLVSSPAEEFGELGKEV